MVKRGARQSKEQRNAKRRAAYARQRAAVEQARAAQLAAERARDALTTQKRVSVALYARYGTTEPLAALGDLRRRFRRLEARRAALIAERDEVVTLCRELGMSWSELARGLGTSRQALMKRGSAASEGPEEPAALPLWD